MEGAVPLVLALALCAYVLATTNVGAANAPLILNEVSEYGLLALGLTVVLVGGGIDLSIGSMVGVCALGAMVADRVWMWPTAVVVPAVIVLGALLGSVNGYLIACRRMRPFITTLVTLIAVRRGGIAHLPERLQHQDRHRSRRLSARLGLPSQRHDHRDTHRVVPLLAVALIVAHLALDAHTVGAGG